MLKGATGSAPHAARMIARIAVGLSIGWTSSVLASPEEEEIVWLDRVQVGLFEEFVRTRAEDLRSDKRMP